MAKKGLNLRDLPQLLSPEEALIIKNYLITAEGGLQKRGGITELFDASSATGITASENWTDDVIIFGYADTKVAAFEISTDTITDIKTDFNTNVTSLQRYGDYFFVASPEDNIQRISRTLNYDAQTANFTEGTLLTGGTSGATATILEDADGGATGTLTLGAITGVFQNNEIITDNNSTPGSATSDGVLTFTITEIAASPKARVIAAVDARLVAGDLESDETAIQYSTVDTGTNPPFNTWTTSATATDGGTVRYRRAGKVNVITNLGMNIIIGADNGKWAFQINTIDSGGTLTKVEDTVMYRIDAGMKKAIQTRDGVFYCNSQGLWQLTSIGQNNISFSDQEFLISEILGDDFFLKANFDNADFIKDDVTNQLLLTYREDSSTNNQLLVYNTELKAFVTFTGWNMNTLFKIGQDLYGGGSLTSKIWKLFDGFSDDGVEIFTRFRQELGIGSLWTRKELLGQYVQGELSQSSSIRIDFDIFDRQGKEVTDKLSLQWTPTVGFVKVTEHGSTPWGGAFGGDVDPSGTIDSFAGFKGRIKNLQRVIVDITENSEVPHTINWLALLTQEKANIRIRNLTQN